MNQGKTFSHPSSSSSVGLFATQMEGRQHLAQRISPGPLKPPRCFFLVVLLLFLSLSNPPLFLEQKDVMGVGGLGTGKGRAGEGCGGALGWGAGGSIEIEGPVLHGGNDPIFG